MMRFLPFIFILAAIGLFFGYVRPTWNGAVAEKKAEVASYDSALDAASRFSSRETELAAERGQISEDQLARLNEFLPDGVDNVQLILDLNSLAGTAGIKLSNFTTSETPNADASDDDTQSAATNPSPTDSLTLSLTATGSYDSFRSFLSGLEQSLRPLDVTALTIESGANGVYTYQVTLTFYWLH